MNPPSHFSQQGLFSEYAFVGFYSEELNVIHIWASIRNLYAMILCLIIPYKFKTVRMPCFIPWC